MNLRNQNCISVIQSSHPFDCQKNSFKTFQKPQKLSSKLKFKTIDASKLRFFEIYLDSLRILSLAGEEKLKSDRRANCSSYKSKRIVGPAFQGASSSNSPQNQQQNNFDRTYGICNVIKCNENAVHNILKKWLMKMEKTIAKIFQIDTDIQPTNGNVSICEEHFSEPSWFERCASESCHEITFTYINQVRI